MPASGRVTASRATWLRSALARMRNRPRLPHPLILARHPRPIVPGDLQAHNCIRQRFASGVIHRWAFEKRGKSLEVAVAGSLITSDGDLAMRAAVDGIAIARVPASSVEVHLASRRLVALLEDWRPRSVGFFLYYPSRRQTPAALQAFIDLVKSRFSAGTQRVASSGTGERGQRGKTRCRRSSAAGSARNSSSSW